MKSVNAWVEDLIANGKPGTTGLGARLWRINRSTQRYLIDFADDFTAEGWEQYDTRQDASHFGVWVNKRRLETLSYCEGVWVALRCPDADHFNAEIAAMNAFHGEGFIAKTVGEEGITAYCQDRELFFIKAGDPEQRQPNVLGALLGG